MGEQRAGAGPHSASTGFDPLRGAQDLAVVGRSFIASYARIVEISLESSLNSCKQNVHTATVSLGSRHHRVPVQSEIAVGQHSSLPAARSKIGAKS